MNPENAYPRDLVGYGAHPPDPRWPGGARIAVSVVLNYEEGGEYSVLHGDAHSETVLTDMDHPAPLYGVRNLNIESVFEYGSRVGFWEIMRLLQGSGFEVACHGQRWIDYQFVAEDAERADMRRNIEIVTRLTGRRPRGWYTGRPSPNTRRLVVEEGGFLYDSDAYNDDLPYWTRVAGRDHLVVPYSLDTNDSRMTRAQGFDLGEHFFAYVRDAFDWLYQRGAEGQPRMMSIGLHNRLIGRPGRIGALARLLDHIQRHDAVWLCNRTAIAQHWIAAHPAASG
jgi:peptidoglycan/xylan/chitin deacetylase (PgdA/CDA1 family)